MDGKIGMFVNDLGGYQGCIAREVRQTAEQEGLEFEVADGEHSAVKQAQQVVHFQFGNSDRRLCVFVIPEVDAIQRGAMESDPTYNLACRLLEKGVGWITLNHGRDDFVHSLRRRFPRLPIALVEIDNVEFGRTQGRQLRRILPHGGSVLCVRGNTLDSACVDRSLGMEQVLEGAGITVSEIEGRWSDDVARGVVHKWITSPIRRGMTPNAIVCQNDHMGRAAREALQALAANGWPELKHIPVLGGDGLAEFGRPWVDRGQLTATVRVTLPGPTAVKQLAAFWRNGTPIPAVTKLGVESYPQIEELAPVN